MRRTLGMIVTAGAALLAAGTAMADDDFCPTRPNLGGSSCTTKPGHVQVEASFVDWQRDDSASEREDRFITADLLLRAGVGSTTEVQLGWTGYGRDRTRDKASSAIDTVHGTGDLRFAMRQRLVGGEGKKLATGIEGFVTAPTGKSPIGDGTWSAGAIVPVEYDLTEKVTVAFTGEADAAANESGHGRHFAYSGIASLEYALSEQVTTTAEVSLERDNDPEGHETHALAALSAAWQPTKVLQLDVLAVAGLNHNSPDMRLVLGGAVLF